MKVLYVILTYERSIITERCLNTLFHKDNLIPDRLVIIDDGSNDQLKKQLTEFQLEKNNTFPVDFFSLGKNLGHGYTVEFSLKIIETYNPDYVYIIESDYIFKNYSTSLIQYLFDNNDIVKNSVGFSGYDNPHYYDYLRQETFMVMMERDFGKDNINRKLLYKPFLVETSFGNINLEFVSNSCGTMYLNWKKILEIKKEFPELYKRWFDDSGRKNEIDRRCMDDGIFSHGLCYMWNEYAIKHNIDRNKYSALINIKPSISQPINGGKYSLHYQHLEENQIDILSLSPSWKN